MWADLTLGQVFLAEFAGTAMLLLLGGGVVANNILPKNKGNGTGFLHVNFGWGIAVWMGVIVAFKTGGHLNPAVTVGLAVKSVVEGMGVNWAQVMVAIVAQFLGAFLGAVLTWLTYRKQFDLSEDKGAKLGVFATGPEDRDYFWNCVTEAMGTFVLLFVIVAAGLIGGKPDLGWLAPMGVAFLIVGIGASLGGPTGYAINPARDLAPRIAHAVLPIKGKGDSDWGYSWVPVVGPMIGGILGAVCGGLLVAAF
ncbi:MIP family channel protein [Gleimia coleocanis DSM 15436]|uniref:MIP family channel protein n=1 Tax=Gleimia coleocanis DSM 15436 TaxID=525245 RepID=C0W0R9_9ACTO|nr:MIP/aquaporin family protein [Gleimia coleocanis]EEH63643.1 MIP family channel protein [Gleimia coleocanis DSM 15436]